MTLHNSLLAAPARLTVLVLAAALGGCVIAPPRPPLPPAPPGLPHLRHAPPPSAMAPLYFYPERDQSDERQDRDRYTCYRLAVRDSGVDPGMTPVTRSWTPPPVRRDGTDVVAGAATGAIVGAAVSRPRHAGQNAVIGAVFGALLGAVAQESRAQAAEAAQDRQAEWAARRRQPIDNFQRAMTACMQARGYTVG